MSKKLQNFTFLRQPDVDAMEYLLKRQNISSKLPINVPTVYIGKSDI
jgi:hypothetical protein